MALDMTTEERELGKQNFEQTKSDLSRRGFLKALGAATAAGGVGVAGYFGYKEFTGEPVKAALIGCGDEGGVLCGEHDPNHVQIVAVSDIRPYNQQRIFEGQGATHIRKGLNVKYGEDAKKIKEYPDGYKTLLADVESGDLDIDMVIIALPLHQHAPASIEAMLAGQKRGRPLHVFCEKLMARTVQQCKDMIRTADETGSLLSIGHQRHYSLLYAHALEVLKAGVLGDVRHIRALWHRNNSWLYEAKPSPAEATKSDLRQPYYRDGWFQPIFEMDYAALADDPARLQEMGFDSMDQLIRWRLYNTTGGGLMAELGSHQLDAASIFLGKVKPIAVSGVGVKSFYGPDHNDRSCDDHVFCTFEFPGPEYDSLKNPNDKVIVTYSSINTNGFENYGECIMGTRGTMIVEAEQAVLMYAEQKPGGKPPRSTNVTVSSVGADQATLDAAASGYTAPTGASASAASTGGPVSRGYTEELSHFAYCVKKWSQTPGYYKRYSNDEGLKQKMEAEDLPRCHGIVAMADAVLALASNVSMEKAERLEFQQEWFDWQAEGVAPDMHIHEELEKDGKLPETMKV